MCFRLGLALWKKQKYSKITLNNAKFEPDTSISVDRFLLIFCNRESTYLWRQDADFHHTNPSTSEVRSRSNLGDRLRQKVMFKLSWAQNRILRNHMLFTEAEPVSSTAPMVPIPTQAIQDFIALLGNQAKSIANQNAQMTQVERDMTAIPCYYLPHPWVKASSVACTIDSVFF